MYVEAYLNDLSVGCVKHLIDLFGLIIAYERLLMGKLYSFCSTICERTIFIASKRRDVYISVMCILKGEK